MRRRQFTSVCAGTVAMLAGCSSGGEAILRKSTRQVSGRSWERELQEGDTLEFAVKITDGMSVTGHVKRLDTGEILAERTETQEGRWSREEFEVPATTDYEIMVSPNGSGEATVRLKDAA